MAFFRKSAKFIYRVIEFVKIRKLALVILMIFPPKWQLWLKNENFWNFSEFSLSIFYFVRLQLNRKRVILCSKRKSKNVDSNAPKTSISKWNRSPKRSSCWSERSKTSFSTKVSSRKKMFLIQKWSISSLIHFSPDSSSSSENDLASAGRKQKLQNYIQKLRNRNKQLFSNNDYSAPPVTRPPVVRTTIRTTTTMAPVRRQYMDYGDRIVLI